MRIGLVVVAALSSAGCASVGTLTPVSNSNVETRYAAGSAVATSKAASSSVTLGSASPSIDPAQRLTFAVEITNWGTSPITVRPGAFTITTDEGKSLRVFTSEQLQKEANRRAFWVAFGAAMQSASNSMNAANAGYKSTYGSYSGTANSYGTYGSTYGSYSGTYTGYTYDASAAAAAQQQANAQNQVITDRAAAQIQDIRANATVGAFQTQTIDPQTAYRSFVTFDKMPSGTHAIDISVAVGEDTHRFSFDYTKQ